MATFMKGDRVRLDPDPAAFSDPRDYAYVMRAGGPAGKTFTVEAVFPATPQRDDLPRSGVPTYKLVDEDGLAAFLAIDSELTYIPARADDAAIHRITVAQRMGETSEQILSLCRQVGLEGITKTKGADSLAAALEDLTRNVAQAMTSTNEDYRAFMVAAGWEGYQS